MFAGIHAALLLLACGLHWACFMSSNAVVAFHGLEMAADGSARNFRAIPSAVAKPTGLFAFATLHVLYGFVVSSNEIASKTIIAEKHFLYQCCVTFSLYVWNGLVFVAFLFCVDARSKRVLCRKQKDADASDV